MRNVILEKTNSNYPKVSEQIRCLLVEKHRTRAKYKSSRLPSYKSAYNKLANSQKESCKI